MACDGKGDCGCASCATRTGARAIAEPPGSAHPAGCGCSEHAAPRKKAIAHGAVRASTVSPYAGVGFGPREGEGASAMRGATRDARAPLSPPQALEARPDPEAELLRHPAFPGPPASAAFAPDVASAPGSSGRVALEPSGQASAVAPPTRGAGSFAAPDAASPQPFARALDEIAAFGEPGKRGKGGGGEAPLRKPKHPDYTFPPALLPPPDPNLQIQFGPLLLGPVHLAPPPVPTAMASQISLPPGSDFDLPADTVPVAGTPPDCPPCCRCMPGTPSPVTPSAVSGPAGGGAASATFAATAGAVSAVLGIEASEALIATVAAPVSASASAGTAAAKDPTQAPPAPDDKAKQAKDAAADAAYHAAKAHEFEQAARHATNAKDAAGFAAQAQDHAEQAQKASEKAAAAASDAKGSSAAAAQASARAASHDADRATRSSNRADASAFQAAGRDAQAANRKQRSSGGGGKAKGAPEGSVDLPARTPLAAAPPMPPAPPSRPPMAPALHPASSVAGSLPVATPDGIVGRAGGFSPSSGSDLSATAVRMGSGTATRDPATRPTLGDRPSVQGFDRLGPALGGAAIGRGPTARPALAAPPGVWTTPVSRDWMFALGDIGAPPKSGNVGGEDLFGWGAVAGRGSQTVVLLDRSGTPRSRVTETAPAGSAPLSLPTALPQGKAPASSGAMSGVGASAPMRSPSRAGPVGSPGATGRAFPLAPPGIGGAPHLQGLTRVPSTQALQPQSGAVETPPAPPRTRGPLVAPTLDPALDRASASPTSAGGMTPEGLAGGAPARGGGGGGGGSGGGARPRTDFEQVVDAKKALDALNVQAADAKTRKVDADKAWAAANAHETELSAKVATESGKGGSASPQALQDLRRQHAEAVRDLHDLAEARRDAVAIAEAAENVAKKAALGVDDRITHLQAAHPTDWAEGLRKAQDRQDRQDLRDVRDLVTSDDPSRHAVTRLEKRNDRAVSSAQGDLASKTQALTRKLDSEQAAHEGRAAQLGQLDAAQRALKRKVEAGTATAKDRTLLGKLEAGESARDAERLSMTQRDRRTAEALVNSLQKQLLRMQHDGKSTDADVKRVKAALEDATARRDGLKKDETDQKKAIAAKKAARKAKGKAGGAAQQPGKIELGPFFLTSGLAGTPNAQDVTFSVAVMTPEGGIYDVDLFAGATQFGSALAAGAIAAAQGFAPENPAASVTPPPVPAVVSQACRASCCTACKAGEVCTCPPPEPVYVDGNEFGPKPTTDGGTKNGKDGETSGSGSHSGPPVTPPPVQPPGSRGAAGSQVPQGGSEVAGDQPSPAPLPGPPDGSEAVKTLEGGGERAGTPEGETTGNAPLHRIPCATGEVVEIPDDWLGVGVIRSTGTRFVLWVGTYLYEFVNLTPQQRDALEAGIKNSKGTVAELRLRGLHLHVRCLGDQESSIRSILWGLTHWGGGTLWDTLQHSNVYAGLTQSAISTVMAKIILGEEVTLSEVIDALIELAFMLFLPLATHLLFRFGRSVGKWIRNVLGRFIRLVKHDPAELDEALSVFRSRLLGHARTDQERALLKEGLDAGEREAELEAKQASKRSGGPDVEPPVARLPNPPTPRDMPLAEFGKVMNWGSGDAAARAQIPKLSRPYLLENGVTKDIAEGWALKYRNEVLVNPRNPSARGRAELMEAAAKLLE